MAKSKKVPIDDVEMFADNLQTHFNSFGWDAWLSGLARRSRGRPLRRLRTDDTARGDSHGARPAARDRAHPVQALNGSSAKPFAGRHG